MTKKIFIEIFITFVTIVAMAVGIYAITDSKLTSFRLGTKYEPAFNIEVYTKTVYNAKESSSLVFKSANQSEVNYNAHYIDSVTNDTILFKTENLVTDDGIVVLTIVNNENKALQAIINKGAQVEIINANSSAEISVEIGTTNLGLFLFSLQIIEYSPYSISYNLTGCTKITAPTQIENKYVEKEIILQANDVDFTKWTISATNCNYVITYDYATSQMRATIKIKNATTNISITAIAEIDYWDGTAEAFPYGNGTEDNPYLIRNGKNLAYLAEFTNAGNDTTGKHYKMMNNIYLNEGTFGIDNETNFNPTYNGSTTIPSTVHQWIEIGYAGNDGNGWYEFPFKGKFDGNGWYIDGLYKKSTSSSYDGLFGSVYGVIRNLGLTNNCYVEAHSSTVGIVALLRSGGLIDNCYNKAYIHGAGASGSGFRAAGICGTVIYGATVSNCYNMGIVKANHSEVGGIVGVCFGNLFNCYNLGKITGSYYVGGIVGMIGSNSNGMGNTYPVMRNCYNFSTISKTANSASSIFGAVAGDYYEVTATIEKCFYWSALHANAVNSTSHSGCTAVSASNYEAVMASLNANAKTNGWRQWVILDSGMPSFI